MFIWKIKLFNLTHNELDEYSILREPCHILLYAREPDATIICDGGSWQIPRNPQANVTENHSAALQLLPWQPDKWLRDANRRDELNGESETRCSRDLVWGGGGSEKLLSAVADPEGGAAGATPPPPHPHSGSLKQKNGHILAEIWSRMRHLRP